MSFSHWLVDENKRFFSHTPLTTGLFDDRFGYQTGPNLFLPKGQY